MDWAYTVCSRDGDVNVALPYNPGSTLKVAVGVLLDDRAADSGRDREPMRAPERGAYRDRDRGGPVMAADPGAAPGGYNYRY